MFKEEMSNRKKIVIGAASFLAATAFLISPLGLKSLHAAEATPATEQDLRKPVESPTINQFSPAALELTQEDVNNHKPKPKPTPTPQPKPPTEPDCDRPGSKDCR